MICLFCNKDTTVRSKAYEGFFCASCDTVLITTINPHPDKIDTESGTTPGIEELYSVYFSAYRNDKTYGVTYFVVRNETEIEYSGDKKGKLLVSGQPLTPTNFQTRLPTILTFL